MRTIIAGAGLLLCAHLVVLERVGPDLLPCGPVIFNCRAVLDSSWAMLAGVPLSVIGFLFYAVYLALSVLPGRLFVKCARLGLALGGFAVGTGLAGVQVFSLRAYCLFCLIDSALLAVLAVLEVVEWRRSESRRESAGPRASVAALAGIGVAGIAWFFGVATPALERAKAHSVSGGGEDPCGGLAAVGAAVPEFREHVADDDLVLGSRDAKIVMHLFVDPQCHSCGVALRNLVPVIERYRGSAAFVVKPIVRLPGSEEWVAAFRAAERVGLGAEFLEHIHSGPGNLGGPLETLNDLFAVRGVDPTDITAAVQAAREDPRTARDETVAGRFGVDSVPRFFLNGREIDYLGSNYSTECMEARLAHAVRAGGDPR